MVGKYSLIRLTFFNGHSELIFLDSLLCDQILELNEIIYSKNPYV